MKSISILNIIFLMLAYGLNAQTQYHYNPQNRLTQITYSTGEVITYTYDLLGNRTGYTITNSVHIDLSLQSQAVVNNNIVAGENSTATCDAHNTGLTGAGGHYLRLYLSTDSNYDVSDIAVGSQYISSIPMMAYQSLSIPINIPSNTNAGNYQLLYFIDADETIAETDENNNVVALPISITAPNEQADYLVSNATASPNALMAGESSNLSYSYQNIGTATGASNYLRCYLSVNMTYESFADTELIGAAHAYEVIANNSAIGNATVMIPGSTIPGGYFLLFYADADETVEESDEGNNITVVPITVLGENPAPTADFSADVTTTCVGEVIHFTPITTGNPTAYAWTFEGGTPASSSASHPSVTWDVAGTYEVSLTVSNVNGSDEEVKSGYVEITDGSSGSGEGWAWVQQVGAAGFEEGRAVDVDNAGNVFVCGRLIANESTLIDFGNGVTTNYTNDFFLAKYNSLGEAQWVQTVPLSSNSSNIYDLVCDDAGNVYFTGNLRGTATFGSTTVTASSSANSLFVAKYNNSGTFQWIDYASSSAYFSTGHAIATDGTNVYTTGYFRNTLTLDNTSVNTSGNWEFFIAKYQPDGNLDWLKRGGGTDSETGTALSFDGEYMTVTGWFKGTAEFGGQTITSTGSADIFIARYLPATGQIQQIMTMGGTGSDYGLALNNDPTSGGFYTSGHFYNTVNFAGTTLTASGSPDFYLARFDSNSNLLWVKQSSSTGYTQAYDIIADGTGQIIVEGIFTATTDFGGTSLTTGNSPTNFIGRYQDTDGTLLSVEIVGGLLNANSTENKPSMGTDSGGNIYRTGLFNTTTSIGDFDITSIGGFDMHLEKWQSSVSCGIGAPMITASGSTTICPGESVTLTAPEAYAYLWSSEATTRSITVGSPGDYSVQIFGCSGCSDVSDVVTVTYDEGTTVAEVLTHPVCEDNSGSIELTITSNTTYDILWDNGATTSTINNLEEGDYSVTVTPNMGCSELVETYTLTSIGAPTTAAFEHTVNGLEVTFTSLSPNATSVSFDLDDGSTNTSTSFTHTYAEYGLYTVCMDATSSCNTSSRCELIKVCDSGCFVVTNTNDSGCGSLRNAMECAKSNDVITFDIQGTPPFVITPQDALPYLGGIGNITLDGTSQPNWQSGDIVLDGSVMNVYTTGLGTGIRYSGGDNYGGFTIKGLTIDNFNKGIFIFRTFDFEISNCIISNNVDIGFSISRSEGGVIKNTEIFNNEKGFYINYLSNNVRLQENSMYCNSIPEWLANSLNGNYPSPNIIQATINEIAGTTTPNDIVEVFYSNNTDCTSAPCQGSTYIGSVTADNQGNWSMEGDFTVGATIVTTATDSPGLKTSKYSTCVEIADCTSSQVSIGNTGPYCEGDIIELTSDVNPIGANINYTWTGPNNYSSNEANPTDATEAGMYSLEVTVDGCLSESVSTEVIQEDIPTITEALTHPICQDNSGVIELTISSNTAYDILWDNGATTNVIDNLVEGDYTVTITPNSACEEIIETYTLNSIETPTTAAFDYNLDGGLTVSFTSLAEHATTINFDLGDGANNASDNFTHTYNTYGTYTVCLSTFNACNSDESCITLELIDRPCLKVTNTNDSGTGSLREAMNCLQNGEVITFNIAGTPPFIITPETALPTLEGVENVAIDATSQPNWYAGAIVLDGSLVNDNLTGLGTGIRCSGNDVRSGFLIKGLKIDNFNKGISMFRIIDFEVVDCILSNNIDIGIAVTNSNHSLIKNTEISNNQKGFYINAQSNNIRLQENSMYCNTYPEWLANSLNDSYPPPSITEADNGEIKGLTSPNAIVEVFSNDDTNCSSTPCQGKIFLGSALANNLGYWSLIGNFTTGSTIITTATDNAGLKTSKYSECAEIIPCHSTQVAAENTGPYCEGSAIELVSTLTPMNEAAMYAWTGPNDYTSTEAHPSDATEAGTYTLAINLYGCTLEVATTEVMIHPNPESPVASSNSPVAPETMLTLSTDFVAGATYAWTGPNNFTSSEQNPTVSTSATMDMAGTYTLTITVNGCESPIGATEVLIESNLCPCEDNCTMIMVTNTDDAGRGSLRQALLCINDNPSLNKIHFDIPGTTPHTISPLSYLPTLENTVSIDGSSQATNNLSSTSPTIIIDGINVTPLPFKAALEITGNGTEIYGLQLINWNTGIQSTAEQAVVIGSIGKGNCLDNIENDAIYINSTDNCIIQSNVIQNSSFAIQLVNANHATIGGTITAQGNIITENNHGIYMNDGSANNLISSNSIYCNLVNPIFTSVSGNEGKLPANTIVTTENQVAGLSNPFDFIQIFKDEDTDCNGFPCQGKELLYSTSTNAVGIWSLPVSIVEGMSITTTATDLNNNTSSFSTCENAIKKLKLIAHDTASPQGETVCVNVSVQSFKDIYTMQYSINWNPTVLQYEQIQFSGVLSSDATLGTNQTNQGILNFSWIGDSEGTTIVDGNSIYEICFTAIGQNGTNTIVELTANPMPIEIVQKDEIELIPTFEAATVTINMPLDVFLLTFDAVAHLTEIELTWQTVDELNLASYELQKSKNGQDFTKLTWQEAGKPTYHYQDSDVQANTMYYYRLKMQNQDGTFEYSPVRSAQIKKNTHFQLYPNPTTGNMTLKMQERSTETGQLYIYNNLGQVVWQQSISRETNQVDLDVVSLSAGVYFLHVQLPQQQWKTKFVKE